ncbi:hypothetical protein Bca4012_082382 [Brassica carinata]
MLTPPPRRDDDHRKEYTASRDIQSSSHKGSPLDGRQINLPRGKYAVAVEAVRGVLLQYANCTDPAESATRRERLIQAEAKGQLEENAALVVRTSLSRNTTVDPEEESPLAMSSGRRSLSSRLGRAAAVVNNQSLPLAPSTERASATSRLGPLSTEINRNSPQNDLNDTSDPQSRAD